MTNNVSSQIYYPDWDEHGRAAGPIRNRDMLKAGADLVVAFPGGRGTADMVSAAKKKGFTVLEVKEAVDDE